MIRTLCLLASVFLLGPMALAQENSAPAKASLPALELKLSSRSLMGCVGSSLPLELELTNRGSEIFRVEKFDIWSHFRYGFLGQRDTGCGGGQGSSCNECLGNIAVIKPNDSYQSSFGFDLKSDFFKDAGKYEIRLVIDGVESNRVEFELFSCE